jgi:hypothetical protein
MRLLLLANEAKNLKPKYKYSFAALPFILIVLSFLPLRLFMNWLAPAFHVSMNAPTGGHIGLFDILTLLAMVVFIVIAYVLGFVGNAAILYLCYGWSADKLRDVFLRSNVPEHWYKSGHGDSQA